MNCLGCGQETKGLVCNKECEQLLRKKINEQIKLQANKKPAGGKNGNKRNS